MANSEPQYALQRIVSGGQTGVDRAALDAAITLGLPHGGWCPSGRRAEDGPIPGHYRLRETASANYPVRTRQNVVDSDATLILYREALVGGTELTYRVARQVGKPFFLVDLADRPAPALAIRWLEDAAIETLNVAGPRESTAPGIAQQTYEFLLRCLAPVREPS